MDMQKNKLPVLNTIYKSITTIADNSLPLFKALLLPSIIMWLVSHWQLLLLQHGKALFDDEVNILKANLLIFISSVGGIIIYGILTAVFAVICHRIVLLGKESLPNNFGIYFSRRELKYLSWFILLSIPIGIGSIVMPSLLALLNSMDYNVSVQVWRKVGIVITTFITAPFLFVLPATAVDEESPFSKARLTVRGNTIRLAAVLIIPMLIRILTIWALEYYGTENNKIINNIFIGVIFYVFMVLETVALSVSYKTLFRKTQAGQ